MDDAGPINDKWNYERVSSKITEEINGKTILVLPMATLIETGNHIAQARGEIYAIAQDLAVIIKKVANEEEPWAAFTAQSELWNEESLVELANEWPDLAVQKLSIGDITIKNVAKYYSDAGYQVEILTADQGLKSYEPAITNTIPRRRKK